VDRLRAQRVLEEGLRKYPDDLGLLLELGRTNYVQGLYGDADRVFSRVIDIDSGNYDAHYYLGLNAYRKWRNVQNYVNHLTTAISHLRIATQCSPVDGEGFPELAFAGYASGDTALAVQTCRVWRRARPLDPRPLFLLGCISYDHGRFEECWRHFRGGIELLPEEDQLSYTNFAVLLDPDDAGGLAHRRAAAGVEAADARRAFWLENDTDPTTEVNERFLEHLYRVFLSEMRYASPRLSLRGWDTPRGRALIKFGQPDQIRTTLEGMRPSDGRAEWWTYSGSRPVFSLQFRDEYLDGNYIVPIRDDVSTETLVYDAPISAHSPRAAAIPCAVDAAAFRAPDRSATVYVVLAADADSLSGRTWSWQIDRYVARAAFFEENAVPFAYFSDTLSAESLPLHPGTGSRKRYIIRRYDLPALAFRVAASLQDDKTLTRSVGWSEVDATRFLGDDLVLSDILLCSTGALDMEPSIRRHGLSLLPNPGRDYLPSENLRTYVEAYNLALADGRCEYDLTYSIFPTGPEPGALEQVLRRLRRLLRVEATTGAVISQSFRGVSAGDTAGEEVEIDIQALEPGAYRLTLAITDRVSGATAEATTQFLKLGPLPD
jgi:GWxTD domain-containing protein